MENESVSGYATVRTAREGETFLDDAAIAANMRLIERDAAVLMDSLLKRLQEPSPGNLQAAEISAYAGPEYLPLSESDRGPYAELLRRCALSSEERTLLLLVLINQFDPSRLVRLIQFVAEGTQIMHAGLGGYLTRQTRRFIPTLSTVLYICSGRNSADAVRNFLQLVTMGTLVREQIIRLRNVEHQEGRYSEFDLQPELAQEYAHHLLYGREARPDFGEDFAAEEVRTHLEWDKHVVLPDKTRAEVMLLHDTILSLENVRKRNSNLAKGMPALFHGPPGTGKTLTAKVLGKLTGRPVFRIDLARIVSKYVGETEKRLALVFDRAEGKDWILFFDEADVLFGRRTGVGDAHDRYANLLTAYLLQRMEDYCGVSLLSTNFKDNIDPAMIRRFLLTIHFPVPEHDERKKLWETAVPEGFELEPGFKLDIIAQAELTGSQIATILKLSAMRGAYRGDYMIRANDIKYFAILEYGKKGITSKVRNWPNRNLLGFARPLALEDPTREGHLYRVADPHSLANINLFEE